MVCGWTRSSTKKVGLFFDAEKIIATASPAAVDSSSSDELESSMPVSEVTIVWKLTRDSRRPCETSAWYGVYWVYHRGFSRMFRRITNGVFVS